MVMDELQPKEALLHAENEAIKKDQQISELLSRMREYEMGEYGLADAVCEIKECRKAIRARDREIENLTHELNHSKLEVSELKEKNRNLKERLEMTTNEFSIFPTGRSSHTKKTRKPKKHKTVENIKPSVLDKAIQCHSTTFAINQAEELYASRVQNEKLRIELKKVCQEATESIIELQKQHRQDCLKNEDIIQKLKDNSQFRNTILMSAHSANESDLGDPKAMKNEMSKSTEDRLNASDKHHYTLDSEAYYKMILTHMTGENSEVEKMLSELSNQIKVLKNNQILLVRRYMALSDAEDILRKENERLKRAFAVNQERNQKINVDTKYKNAKDYTESNNCLFSHKEMSNETTILEAHRIKSEKLPFLPSSASNDSMDSCNKSQCIANAVRVSELVGLEIELLEEMSHIKKLLEISRHQTRALETVCFSQEIELKAVREQFILFQIQSDERMILGKLAMKVLQLQFSHAACIYELKKYKLDKEALEDLCSSLQKEYEENEKRLSMSYLEAHMKIKSLTEVLQDLCRRCNEAVSTFVDPEHKTK